MNNLWIVLVGLAWFCNSAQGGAVVEYRIVSFNSNGRDDRGDCCDTIFGICDCCCDLTFRFCLDLVTGNTSPESCAYLVKTTSGHFDDTDNIVFHTQNILGVPNPITYTFHTWPGGVKFKSRVKDYDPHNSDDNVDTFNDAFRGTPSPAYQGRTIHERTLQGRRSAHKTSLKIQVSAYCQENYYGPYCNVYCVARDDYTGHFTCDPDTGEKICRPGWEDPSLDCTRWFDDCVNMPCLNAARCEDGNRRYICHCLAGYTGDRCETNINECASIPCLNGGTCLDHLNRYLCLCQPGFVGPTCADHLCDVTVQCQNGGTCVNHGECDCLPDFTGDTCETHICNITVCQNGGLCGPGGVCHCLDGFTGLRCEVDICDHHACHNGGTCDAGRCQCSPGWNGTHCEIPVNECESDPCAHAGTCRDHHLSYTCQCLPQYTGDNCESVLDGNDTVIVIDTDSDMQTSDDKPDTAASSPQPQQSHTGLIAGLIGGIFLAILVVIIAIAVVYRHRKKSTGSDTESSTANFDNPLYHEANSPAGGAPVPVAAVPAPMEATGGIYPNIAEENPYDNIGPGHLTRTIPNPVKPALPQRPSIYDTPKSRADNNVYDNPPVRYPPNSHQATGEKKPIEENPYETPAPGPPKYAP